MFCKDGLAIRDEFGRQRIFKGVNICIKKDKFNYFVYKLEKRFDKTFAEYVENGINVIRLGFNWSALEPEKNCFDERAFEFLKKFVSTAQENNIYVLLDVHQDLYCSKFGFGDGAPSWVTKDYPRKRPVAIWAEGYFYFKDVQRAFNDFWRNKNNVQTDFSEFWDKLVLEFKDFDNVIGYDFLNYRLFKQNLLPTCRQRT